MHKDKRALDDLDAKTLLHATIFAVTTNGRCVAIGRRYATTAAIFRTSARLLDDDERARSESTLFRHDGGLRTPRADSYARGKLTTGFDYANTIN